MPLYGHELNEEIDPIQAGLKWAVKTKDRDFIGMQAMKDKPADRPVRVGLKLNDKKIAREGYEIKSNDVAIGTVTSGAYTPTVEASIAMGYVPPAYAELGAELFVQVRKDAVSANVVELPFYKREQ